jgi:hypothetical protein
LSIKIPKSEELFLNHNKNFFKIKDELKFIYSDYPNKNIIINLLDWWLYLTIVSINVKSKSQLEEFINNKKSTIIGFLSNDLLILQKRKMKLMNINFIFILFFSLKNILYTIGIPANLNRNNLSNKLGVFLLKNYKIKINKELSVKIFNVLNKYNNNSLFNIIIKNKIPEIFISNKILLFKNKKEFNLYGSMHSFIDNQNFEYILLINRPLYITGFQHGGSYGIFQKSFYHNYEIVLSNKFLGYNLYDNNLYKYNNIFEYKNFKRIILIERPIMPDIVNLYHQYNYKHHTSNESIDYIFNELKNTKQFILYTIPYPNNQYSYYNNYKRNIINNKTNAKKIIQVNDLIIFDVVTHSLIYHCLNNNINFLIILEPKILSNFTEKMKIWVNELYHSGFIIYTTEKNKFKDLLIQLHNSF